ncbi:MAG: hypothetical protein WD688_10085 [Candidatus Binatia bacterium]
MKKSISLLTNLLLSSTLFWGVPSASGQETIARVPADTTSYCHMKFPSIREDTLFSVNPMLDESTGNIIDFYGSCDHDPLGVDEVRTQKELLLRGYSSDGE